MSNQLTLDDIDTRRSPLPVRDDDPVTSRAGAKSVKESERRAEVIRGLGKIGGRGTAREIHNAMQPTLMDIGSVRSRLAQIVADESDQRARRTSGTKTIERPAGTGRPEQVWALTDKGRAYLADRSAT